MEQLSNILLASVTLLAIISGLIFAAAEGAPLAALTLPIGLVTWSLCDRRQRFHLPAWGLNVGGVLAVAAAVYELASGNIEARLLSGGHLLVYLTWLFMFQSKQDRTLWWIAALCILQVAVASVLTSAPWFGAMLILWLLLIMWCMAVFTMQRSVAATQVRLPAIASDSLSVTSSSVTHAIPGLRLDEHFQLLSPRFAGAVAGATFAGLLMSLIFFSLIPRVWMSRMRFFDDTSLRSTVSGSPFMDEVRLGDIGEIMARHEIALDAEFYSHPLRRPVPKVNASLWLGDSPLFRARTLEHYSKGRWDSLNARPFQPQVPPPQRPLMRTDITLQAVSSATLFTLGNTVTCTTNVDGFSIDRRILTGEFVRSEDLPIERFRYSVYSELDVHPARWSIRPRENRLSRAPLTFGRWDYEPGHLLQLPSELPSVPMLTQAALKDLPANASNNTKALRIEAYLRDSGLFEYSSRPSVNDKDIDPLEDFLVNRRSGHCEYFASALALMLRSAKIPSRLVMGFKGGDWDDRTGRFIVLERHAHAWVEALVEEGWLTLDATPADRDAEIDRAALTSKSWLASIGDLFRLLWSDGIGLNSAQQRELIYRPLSDFGAGAWRRVLDFRGTLHAAGAFVLDILRNPQKWISWRGGLTVFSLLTAIVLIIRGLIRLTGKLRRWRAADSGHEPRRILVPFYQRFRDIVGQAGLTPSPAQTAAEFSRTVEQTLAESLNHQGLSHFPSTLSHDYYRVRFGGETLSADEVAELDRRLEQLDHCLSRPADVNSAHDLRSR